jgi:uncharacterized protein (TIGR03067 family)
MTLTRRISLTSSATALAVLLAVLHHRARPEAAERIDLHGTWRIISHQINDHELPAAATVAIDGVAMTFSFQNPGEPDATAPFRLNSRAVPKEMDIRFPMREGSVPANGWDGLTRAVYDREQSSLTLVWHGNDIANPDPNRRPTQVARLPKAYTMRLILAR